MAAKDFRDRGDKPDRSKKVKADWRAKGKSGAGSRAKGAKNAAWTEKTGDAFKHAKLRYRLKIGVWLTILISLVGVFVAYVLWRPGRTPFLALAVTRYGDPMADVCIPNAWAAEDVERFHELGGDARVLEYSRVSYATEEAKLDGLKNLGRNLLATKRGGPRKNLVIVYLSMHGVVDGDGRPCLLPPDASPYDTDTWLPIEEVLAYLFPKDKLDRLPEKKLLILDCNRMDVNWRLGLLYNSFADRLEDVFKRAEVPGLMILNSAGPGEVGWSSAGQLQGSVFAHYLYRGLSGEADDNDNKRVSLSELHAYVRSGVRQWVRSSRNDRQLPLLLTAEKDDVELVFNREHRPAAGPTVDLATGSRWSEVARFWTDYHEPNREIAHRLKPMLWERFQNKLLRLERLLLAGGAYEGEFTSVSKTVRDLAEQLDETPLPGALAAHSLPLGRQLGTVATTQPTQPGRGYLETAEANWASMLADPGGASWKERLSAVNAARGQGIDVVEIHFSRMLYHHLDPDTWRQNPQLVQAALSARQLAELAAAPPDAKTDALLSQRAHYWTGPSIDAADAARRLAEDSLFIGGPPELDSARGLYAKLTGGEANIGQYRKAGQLARQVSAAYQLRDRARATTPYLAQWIFARLSRPKPSELDDLAKLIQATDELEAKLEASLAAGEWRAELDSLTGLIAQKLAALEDSFDRECSELEDARLQDPETLKGISVVLDTPLVTGTSRMLLLEKLLGADSKRADGDGPPVGAGTRPGDDATDDGGDKQNGNPIQIYARRLAVFSRHPAPALLSGLVTEETSPAVEAPEEFNPRVVFHQPGRVVRRSLASLDNRLGQLPRRMEEVFPASKETSQLPSEVRAGLAKADQLVRAAAPLSAQRKSDYRREVVVEPAVLLRRLDMHYLLQWHCRRGLEDFWGPADQEGLTKPYFALVARDYLDSAAELVGPMAGTTRGRVDLEALLKARTRAVLRPVAKNLRVDDGEFARPAELRLSVAAGQDLPPGEAAVYLSDSAGEGTIPLLSAEDLEQSDLRRIGVEVAPAGGAKQSDTVLPRHWVANNSLADGAGRLSAIALYRGHRLLCPVVVERLGVGIPIEYVPPDYSDPTVTVFGKAMHKSAVMFIFDCSGSMAERMTTADDTGTATTYRFDEARTAMGVILSELADIEDTPYQVGVLAYGHRVGWEDFGNGLEQAVWDPAVPVSKSARGERVRKDRVEGDLPHPNMDIEQLWPLSPFSEFERKSLTAKLNEMRPLGETPLYKSILRAVEVLRRGNAPVNHIIAITDGVNDRSGVAPDDTVLPSHVKQAIRGLGAGEFRLDIVAINTNDKDIEQYLAGLMPNSTAADREVALDKQIAKRDDLKELANSTGGKFYPADDPDRLLAALKDSLQLSHYEVVKLSGGEVVRKNPLGKKSRIEQASDARVDYLVRVPDRQQTAQSKITLMGGEGLELHLDRSANRLIHRRYFAQQQAAGRDSVEQVANPQGNDDSQPANIFVGAHLPARDGDTVRFGVSVQNQDETAFSPRPVEAWVQISPLVSGKQMLGGYIFYDPVFIEDRPVPIIECAAQQWPVEATEARITIFCKYLATDAETFDAITVDELDARGTYTVDGLPGVRFSLDKRRSDSGGDYQIVLMERHEKGSKLDSAKLAMYPPPKRTVHRFRHEKAEVYHFFHYDDAAAENNKIGGYRVIISPRSALSEDAVTLPEPLVVRIPD